MMFARDIDLLRIEPMLFDLVRFHANVVLARQSLIVDEDGVVSIAGHQGLGDQGFVLQSDNGLYEIAQEVSPAKYQLHRDPALTDGATLPILIADDFVAVKVATFRPQIAVVHTQLMRSVGLTSDIDESKVLNQTELVALESYAALHLIFAAASGVGEKADGFERRAAIHLERFQDERERVGFLVDTDGSGTGNAVRRVSNLQLGRA
ncbi:MAG: hypothetical protein AAGB34_06235 [Planctomycetota bacterium]